MNLREFVKNSLIKARSGNETEFFYQYESNNGLFILKGTVKNGIADFEITRTVDGHRCSRVPVFQMPLTDDLIADIAEIAVESL